MIWNILNSNHQTLPLSMAPYSVPLTCGASRMPEHETLLTIRTATQSQPTADDSYHILDGWRWNKLRVWHRIHLFVIIFFSKTMTILQRKKSSMHTIRNKRKRRTLNQFGFTVRFKRSRRANGSMVDIDKFCSCNDDFSTVTGVTTAHRHTPAISRTTEK